MIEIDDDTMTPRLVIRRELAGMTVMESDFSNSMVRLPLRGDQDKPFFLKLDLLHWL